MTQKKRLAAALTILAGTLLVPLAQANAQPSPPQTRLDSQKDWNAYIYKDSSGASVCYASSQPKKTEPTNVKRDPIYFFITTRPAQNVRNEISIAIGYPFKEGSDVTVEIGNHTYTLFTKDDFAWVRNPSDQPAMIADLKGGSSMVVKGLSRRGTNTTDTYSLSGVTAVLNTIDQRCR